MTLSEILNYILYALSGFCFGIFASRYSVLAAVKIAEALRQNGITGIIGTLPQLLFIIGSFFLFPIWFITKTPTGGFFYCAVLIFFFSKGYRIYIKDRR